MGEYPLLMIVIEVAEAVALVAVILMVIKLWREFKVPG